MQLASNMETFHSYLRGDTDEPHLCDVDGNTLSRSEETTSTTINCLQVASH